MSGVTLFFEGWSPFLFSGCFELLCDEAELRDMANREAARMIGRNAPEFLPRTTVEADGTVMVGSYAVGRFTAWQRANTKAAHPSITQIQF